MNLCYTSTSYLPAIGGAQLHTHRIIQELLGKHDIRVVSQWSENRHDWLLGTTLKAPEEAKPYVFEGVPVSQITLSAEERRRILPHVLGYYAITGRAIDRISEVLVPKIRAVASGCDLIHNARIGREPLSFASLKVARQLGVPFVFVPYHHPRWVGWRYRHYLSLYQMADVVIVLTEVEKRTLIGLGVRPERVAVTGIGPLLAEHVDGERFRERYSLGSDPVVLFVGQQYRYKGLAPLLKAGPAIWQKHPNARLVFIGPQTTYSIRLFRGVSDGRILNLGPVDLQLKTDALAACDVLCVPSSQESFGGVYTEAWTQGKPVVGGNIPAIREVIDDGVDGYAVDQDPRQIADRVNRLFENPRLRDEMGQAGRRKVLAHYAWSDLAKRTEEAYELALSRD